MNEWMTQKQAIEFFNRPKRTLQRWVERYGVRRRINREGYVEYNLEDLDRAHYHSRHRGATPPE